MISGLVFSVWYWAESVWVRGAVGIFACMPLFNVLTTRGAIESQSSLWCGCGFGSDRCCQSSLEVEGLLRRLALVLAALLVLLLLLLLPRQLLL